tara:strand:- start:1786 stop:2214 length:429 start_codon:yes stop_codon:yes gene_type:complete
MKNLKTIFFLLIIFLITSCSSVPTKDEVDNADYGESVSSSECQMLAKTFIRNRLKDPSSAQFNSVVCYRGWLASSPIVGVPVTFGYTFGGYVNGRNSFGGYSGFTSFQGVVRDDGYGARVVRYCITDITSDTGICIPQMVNQ